MVPAVGNGRGGDWQPLACHRQAPRCQGVLEVLDQGAKGVSRRAFLTSDSILTLFGVLTTEKKQKYEKGQVCLFGYRVCSSTREWAELPGVAQRFGTSHIAGSSRFHP